MAVSGAQCLSWRVLGTFQIPPGTFKAEAPESTKTGRLRTQKCF